MESDSELGWRYNISAFLTGSQVMPRLMVCGPHVEYLQCRSALLQFVGASASLDFPGASDSKDSACNARDLGSIPGLGRSPGERNGNPLQYSCLENPMGREACWVMVHSVTNSQTRL